jgi:hypothetical protein
MWSCNLQSWRSSHRICQNQRCLLKHYPVLLSCVFLPTATWIATFQHDTSFESQLTLIFPSLLSFSIAAWNLQKIWQTAADTRSLWPWCFDSSEIFIFPVCLSSSYSFSHHSSILVRINNRNLDTIKYNLACSNKDIITQARGVGVNHSAFFQAMPQPLKQESSWPSLRDYHHSTKRSVFPCEDISVIIFRCVSDRWHRVLDLIVI